MRAPVRSNSLSALEPSESSSSKPERPPRRTRLAGSLVRPGLWLALLLTACGTGLAVLWMTGLVPRPGSTVVLLLIASALVNLLLISLFFFLRDRVGRRQDEARLYQRELRYYRTWASEEGILRKAGLIRDLNDLGADPGDLDQIALPKADLRGVNLQGCNLREADLSEADLQGANLDEADLWGANLSGANLTLATLEGAVLRGCDLNNAILLKADLTDTNLHRADLTGANLEGADLTGARIDRAQFGVSSPGGLPQAIHPSVEDWIRERLDSGGYYREEHPETEE